MESLFFAPERKKQFDFVHTFNNCIYRATESLSLALRGVWCFIAVNMSMRYSLSKYCAFANKSSRCVSGERCRAVFSGAEACAREWLICTR